VVLVGDIDLIQTLHEGRERNAKAKRERDKKESKNRLRVVDADSDRRKTWKRINDLVPLAINVLAKARREGNLTPQAITAASDIEDTR